MKKEAWQIARDKRIKEQSKGMENMTDDQVEAVDIAFKSLEQSVFMIKETNDLYMSDVAKMEEAYYKLRSAFNKDGGTQ